MISKITIEDFKGISRPVEIELKPITLLFGANSSGKSTIIQAIHYACEIFLRNNLDADTTLFGGNWVDLGGFKNFIHGHNLNNSFSIKIHLDLSNTDLPDVGIGTQEEALAEECGLVLHRIENACIGVGVSWDSLASRVLVSSYSVEFNDKPFAKIVSYFGGTQPQLAFLDLQHPILVPEKSEGLGLLQAFFGDSAATERGEGLGIYGTSGAMPLWDKSVSTVLSDNVNPSLRGGSTGRPPRGGGTARRENSKDRESELLLSADWFLNKLLVGVGRLVRQELQSFRYIGPIRTIPSRSFVTARSLEHGRWADGAAAWDYIFNPDNNVREINEWLGEEHLNCGYNISFDDYLDWKKIDKKRRLMLAKESLSIWDQGLNKDELKRVVCLKDLKSGINVRPQDIGVGISQLMPVVVGALSAHSGILAIEQPELHIHPALQTRMGDLFIYSTQSENPLAKRVLIETHSEHMILRLLRRIRETAENKRQPKNLRLLPSQVNVIYMTSNKSGATASSLRIDNEGEFIDKWPNGFFEERGEELFGK